METVKIKKENDKTIIEIENHIFEMSTKRAILRAIEKALYESNEIK